MKVRKFHEYAHNEDERIKEKQINIRFVFNVKPLYIVVYQRTYNIFTEKKHVRKDYMAAHAWPYG